MLLSQLNEISDIDSEIIELHERLESLYQQRADLTTIKKSTKRVSLNVLDDTINLDDIDLSL